MQSIPTNFWMWLATLNQKEREGLTVGIVFVIIIFITTIGLVVYLIHRNKTEDALKRELLDRGMSADEIATVIRAKPEKKSSLR
jgi:hypothetical protein